MSRIYIAADFLEFKLQNDIDQYRLSNVIQFIDTISSKMYFIFIICKKFKTPTT